MFKINQYIVYNSMGVYKIVDIRTEELITNEKIQYYVLEPAFKDNMTIKIPVGNDKVLMRGVISKEDAVSVIEAMPKTETVWISNNKARTDSFMKALRSNECGQLVELIKLLHEEKVERTSLGKKLWKKDEDIMKVAERNLYEEFAIALKISPAEVLPFIREHVS
ncbi:CarD-like transcriptional regulator [Desulfitobacterium dichloroeliminans LMG P-21439]|uniref:CarD-like transcriptional regulator n=1 Tax=Desulfitobacterium dichloroeliminans (strain LMG P-21439 / DCA1) TaxID=871963 RepID=L0F7J3_DESDL|nr:CarD family transcriptional regulator [Desulfitobacterium dichloroeliminans]AGA68928.1 CarD-like transcriptional regulator [Desulfitobacterium dichloroeliminans LMG P-21439]